MTNAGDSLQDILDISMTPILALDGRDGRYITRTKSMSPGGEKDQTDEKHKPGGSGRERHLERLLPMSLVWCTGWEWI